MPRGIEPGHKSRVSHSNRTPVGGLRGGRWVSGVGLQLVTSNCHVAKYNTDLEPYNDEGYHLLSAYCILNFLRWYGPKGWWQQPLKKQAFTLMKHGFAFAWQFAFLFVRSPISHELRS